MKNISTGFGLCVLGLGIAAWPVLDRLVPQANAVGIGTTAVTAVAASATAQDPPAPTVVWMGVTTGTSNGANYFVYHRLWSDGRQETRTVQGGWPDTGYPDYPCGYYPEFVPGGCSYNWREIQPPPSGNGFACRADIDGNRVVDGADLGTILANWGAQPPCQPEATFPCMTVGGGQFVK